MQDTVTVEISERLYTSAIGAIEVLLIGEDVTDAQLDAANHALTYLDTVAEYLVKENLRLNAEAKQRDEQNANATKEIERLSAKLEAAQTALRAIAKVASDPNEPSPREVIAVICRDNLPEHIR